MKAKRDQRLGVLDGARVGAGRPFTVVVAIDFGHAAIRGVDVALHAARRHGVAEVHLVGVVAPALLGGLASLGATTAAIDELRARLETVARTVRPRRGVRFVCHASAGAPAREILDVARAVSADLVVLGTEGPRGLLGRLRGSVAARVMQAAPCRVLTIHPPRLVPPVGDYVVGATCSVRRS